MEFKASKDKLDCRVNKEIRVIKGDLVHKAYKEKLVFRVYKVYSGLMVPREIKVGRDLWVYRDRRV
jgi:hypothetical protein